MLMITDSKNGNMLQSLHALLVDAFLEYAKYQALPPGSIVNCVTILLS